MAGPVPNGGAGLADFMSTSSVLPLSGSSLGTSTPSTSNSNGTYFTGLSNYSSDLNQVISQAVDIASLPMENLNTQLTELQAQTSILQTLSTDFSGLQDAVSGIGSATGLSSYGASVSNTNVASAVVSSGVLDGSYTLNVTSLGSVTSAMSNDGLLTVTDPASSNISSSSSYTLTVDGTNYQVNLSNGDTLDDLVSAINSSAAPVQATIVNIGSSSSPDYRLSLQGTNYAADTVQLTDDSQNPLLETLATGAPVTYQVNGLPTDGISSNSRTITLSPGLTATLNATGSTNITVSQDGNSIATALSSFVSSYNAVVGQLDQSHGQNANALAGNSIVLTLEQDLQQIGSYQGTGGSSVNTLSDLGLSFTDQGQLQFNQSTFDAASAQSLGDVLNFLGSPTASDGTGGSGFLGAATNVLTSVMDPTKGSLTAAINANGTEVTSTNTQISNDQAQVNQIQQNLTQQMATADATIASLQQEATEVTNLFQAEALNTLNLTGGVGSG